MLQAGRWNFLTTAEAGSPLFAFQSEQSGIDTLLLVRPAPLRGQGHRLDLHRIETGKSANTSLVEGHWFSVSCS